VKLPAKTQSGKTLRLKGKGMPGLGGKKQGDLYVKIKIFFPEKMTKTKKKQFEEFLQGYDENPRERLVV
jgi:molecular chaperone DnaJ